jgi:hypothetical protein
MGGIHLIRNSDRDFAQSGLKAARAQFARHGFAEPDEHALPGWTLLHAPFVYGGPETMLAEGGDLIAVAGTLTYDGLMGRAALAAMLRDVDPPSLDWSRLGGQFVAMLHKRGRSFVFTDYFAAFQLFHDAEGRFFTTSLLSATEMLPRLHFDPQGVYELAFNVMPTGNDTVFAELKTLGPDSVIELTGDGYVTHPVVRALPDKAIAMPLGERIERHRARLDAIVRPHVRAFGNDVNSPLSGGLDSRLLLAALRSNGCTPRVYVYGLDHESDVRIARAIGAAEGFDVHCDNKLRPDFAPDEMAAQTEHDFQQFDALPTFGNIFDDGSGTAAFDRRHANGALAASGGCGEVYRDFFYLADRPFSAMQVAETFFGRFDARDATAQFDGRAFLNRIAGKIEDALHVPHGSGALPRTMIEQVYPRIRCRALFGREISLEGRHGAYLMPFLDQNVVTESLTLPLALKRAGDFEAKLLAAIDPGLAAHMSSYGHAFTEPPGRRHRFDEWATRRRPTWVRRHSYALRRRLGPTGDEHGGLLAREYLSRVIDLDYPAMRAFFRMENITDDGLRRRIANLEYLAQYLGSKLVTDAAPMG